MKPAFALRLRSALAALALVVAADSAIAMIYPEHRDIAVLGVKALDAERLALFNRLWSEARVGAEQRLCEQPADGGQGLAPACVDWAAFTAIAGDHSCSSRNMLDDVLATSWMLQVADVAAQLKVDLSRVAVNAPADTKPGDKNLVLDFQRMVENEAVRAQRLNALRTADTRLQRADPQYATRAGSNNAHFLLPRPRTDTTALEYARLALSPGSEVSAIGVYAWFHLSALQKATRLTSEQLGPAERQALARAMLADEGFALHFLQDSFSAGHVAGAWGDVSQRKGTHDHYNEYGLEAFTWTGGNQSMVLMGDAHMRLEDLERAAVAVRVSLEQLVDHATGRGRPVRVPHTPAAPSQPDGLDICKTSTFTRRDDGLRATPEAYAQVPEVLGPTPVPGLGPGLGSLPRFRSEVGPFVGFAGAIDARSVEGGFDPGVASVGWVGGADLSVRVGLGLDGVLGEGGDGLVFASLGLRGDTRSTHDRTASSAALDAAGGIAAIPSRIGISTRLRLPFYLVPGDLLFMAPMYLVAPDAYTNMAVTASNGGLLPWQTGWATRFGRFQFVLGRELGATFYGYGFDSNIVLPAGTPGGDPRIVALKSINFDLPILEYRPYRAFDTRQSSAALVQLFVGADVPQRATVTWPPGAPGAKLETVYSIGIRFIFDWRSYF